MERNLIGELNMMKENGAKPNLTDIAVVSRKVV